MRWPFVLVWLLSACIAGAAEAQTISALPPVASLTGSEYFPVVQQGVTKRALVSQVAGGGGGGTGTVTSVGTGAGLTGGPITTTGTISILPNGVTLGDLSQVGANTLLGNWSNAVGNVTANVVPGCSTSASALIYTSGAGLGCNTAIVAASAATVTTNANLTGDVTSVGNATTLATVNPNVGSFTSANITVNAKGLVTAAANGSGGGSGCAVTGTQYQPVVVNAAGTGCQADSAALLNGGVLTLGTSGGVAGSLVLGGSVSGTLTLQPVAGALSGITATFPDFSSTVAELGVAQTWSAVQIFGQNELYLTTSAAGTDILQGLGASIYTPTFPANSGTIGEINLAQTWSALQTFTNSDLCLLGSSTGCTTFTSANAGTTAYTVTVPANTGTFAETNLAQNFTALQSHATGDLAFSNSGGGATTLAGASSASNFTATFPAATDTVVELTQTQTLTNKSLAGTEVNSGLVGVTYGGTGANLSATGGTGQVLQQTTSGGAVTVGQLAATSLTGILPVANGGAGVSLASTGGTSQVLQQTSSGGNISVGQLAASALSNGVTGSGAVVLATSPTVSALTISGISGSTQCVQANSSGVLSGTGSACGSGGGGVTTTGTPTSGELTTFSGSNTITNGNLTGDCTTAGTLTTSCTKTGGVSFGPLATAADLSSPGPIGSGTPAQGFFTQLVFTTTFNQIGENSPLCSATAPTISSGFGTSASVVQQNGTCAFEVNVGTGGTATSGVIGLPTALHGWVCQATDITTNSITVFITKQTASSTTSCTVGNFSDVAAASAWSASDKLYVLAMSF